MTLPFRREFLQAIREGRKTCTARTKPYGEKGEILSTPAGPIVILEIVNLELRTVRDCLWQSEGCQSPADFERIWNVIHPRRGFDPGQSVHVHFFKLAGKADTFPPPYDDWNSPEDADYDKKAK